MSDKKQIAPKSTPFDLSSLNTTKTGDEGAVLHLLHPATDEPLYLDEEKKKPVTITLYGADSTRFRNLNSRLARQVQGKKGKPSIEAVEEATTAQLVGITKDWENMIFGGELTEFTNQKVTNVYDEYRWIREQVSNFITDRANFL